MKKITLDKQLERMFVQRGQGTHYGYQGIARVYSGPQTAIKVEDYPTCGVVVEDYARDMAKNLENSALFEAIVGEKHGRSYLIRARQLPFARK